MRDGNISKFFWPVVYDTETEEFVPLPASLLATNTTSALVFDEPRELGTQLQYVTKYKVPPGSGSHTLDPMVIPVAVDGYVPHTRDAFIKKPNWLRVHFTDGLWVDPPVGVHGKYIDQKISYEEENIFVTQYDFRRALKDCDGNDIKAFEESTGDNALVTCVILMRKISELQSYVNSLVDEFRKRIDSVFDGSGATTNIIQGGSDAGLDQSQDVAIPIEVKVGVYAPHGTSTEDEKLRVPLVVADKSSMQAGETYALDSFHVHNGNKVYQGTFYYSASGPGWEYGGGNKAVIAVTPLATESFLLSRERIVQEYNFVLRALRSGESAANVSPMPAPYGVA